MPAFGAKTAASAFGFRVQIGIIIERTWNTNNISEKLSMI
jgi:hypothetical protein